MHAARPWRIHELTRDFRLEDVWALDTPGSVDDFALLVDWITSGRASTRSSPVLSALWTARWKLGSILGWDTPEAGLGSRVASLRERLPADLAAAPRGPAFRRLPFNPVYLLPDEAAAETANLTVHGVVHFGWVPEGKGRYRGELAVYVKPNGLLGRVYLAAIRPFRYLVVYPAALRRLEREWRSLRGPGPGSGIRGQHRSA